VAIRRGEVGRHREWMLRAYALAAGISIVRLVDAALDLAFAPFGMSPATMFVISIWLGWIITGGAAEFWIARTRPSARARIDIVGAV
jgi:hypothetical protein